MVLARFALAVLLCLVACSPDSGSEAIDPVAAPGRPAGDSSLPSAPPPPAPTRGDLQLDPGEAQLGEVLRGQAQDIEYGITNGFNRTIRLHSARSSCGCAVPEELEGELAPGESTVLRVHFDAATVEDGRFTKEIKFQAEVDGAQRDYLVLFRGRMRTIFQVDPPFAGFGQVLCGDAKTRTLWVSAGHDFQLGAPVCDDPRVQTELQPKAGSRQGVQLTFASQPPYGAVNAVVTLPTQRAEQPQLILAVRAGVEAVMVEPQTANFHRVKQDEVKELALVVRSDAGGVELADFRLEASVFAQPLTLSDSRCPFEVEVQVTDDPTRTPLVLRLVGERLRVPVLQGTLTFATGRVESPRASVKVVAIAGR